MGQTARISKNNTVVMRNEDKTTVILHQTPVVIVDHKERAVTYNTGGWLTTTTIARMNQASNELGLPYRLSRAGGVLSARNYITSSEHSTPSNTLTLPL